MKKPYHSICGLLALAACSPFPSAASAAAESPDVARHVARAMEVASTDLAAEAKAMCAAPPSGPRPARAEQTGPDGKPMLRGSEPYPATRLGDNFWYFGRQSIGAHVIQTSEGIIVIDSMNNGKDIEEALIGGMKSVGLDPGQIKWLIVTHDHGDHYGGSQYLRDHYGVRIAEGKADWEGPGQEQGPPGWVPLGSKAHFQPGDIAVEDSATLTLGDTMVTMVVVPGHTPGTLSLLYPVRIDGKTETVMQWGGGVPQNYDPKAVRHFINDFAKAAQPSLAVGSHPMERLKDMDAIREYPDAPHPMVLGKEKFARLLDIMLECNAANAARSGS